MNELKKIALGLLCRNMSVIPVGPDKKPLVPWKAYQTRLATVEEVEKWFTDFPDAQIGLVTGKISGVVVVDVEAGGEDAYLPKTTTAKTGGGGKHFYYTYRPFSNKARIKPLTDIRADGGYVVFPPSKSSKGSYEWLAKVDPLPDFPVEFFEDKPTVTAPVDSEYPGYNEGQRNDQMAKHIGRLLVQIHPSDWDTMAWKEAMAADQKNTPPMGERELRTIFNSIKGREKTNHATRWRTRADLIRYDDKDEITTLAEIAGRQSAFVSESYPTGIDICDSATSNGGAQNGDLIIISAPTGQGKTTLAQTMTYNFFQLGLISLWFSYEVLEVNLWNTFKGMGISDDFVVYAPFKTTTGKLEWLHNKILEAKKKYWVKCVFIDHLGFLLPKANGVSDISKNYSAYLGSVCRDLKNIAKEEELIIVLMVHMRKTDDPTINDIRDSSGIAQEADMVLLLNREENNDPNIGDFYTDYTKITVGKNRRGGRHPYGWFKIVQNKFWHDSFYKPQPKKKKYWGK